MELDAATLRNIFSRTDPELFSEEILDAMYRLSLIVLNSTEYFNNRAKTAGMLQYCASFVERYPSKKYTYQFFIDRAHALGSTTYKSDLKIFRENIIKRMGELPSETFKRSAAIEYIYKDCTDFFISFIRKLVDECQQLGGAKCEYSIIGFGSLARGVMTPWSDIEFGILISSEEHKEYFRELTELLHIKVVNLGETKLRLLGIEFLNDFRTGGDDWFWDDMIPAGFSFDGPQWHACCTPLGRQNYMKGADSMVNFELIQTPEQMAALQYVLLESDPRLAISIRSAVLIGGSQDLYEEYKKYTEAGTEAGTELVKKNVLEELKKEIREYRPVPPGAVIDVKRNVYRCVERVLCRLAEYYGVLMGWDGTTLWNVSNKIREYDPILSYKLGLCEPDFKNALAIACELRILVYANMGRSKDLFCVGDQVGEYFCFKDVEIYNYFYKTVTTMVAVLEAAL